MTDILYNTSRTVKTDGEDFLSKFQNYYDETSLDDKDSAEQLFFELDQSLGKKNHDDHIILLKELEYAIKKAYGEKAWRDLYDNSILKGKDSEYHINSESELIEIMTTLDGMEHKSALTFSDILENYETSGDATQLLFDLDLSLGTKNGDKQIEVEELEHVIVTEYSRAVWEELRQLEPLKNMGNKDLIDENTDLDKIMAQLENLKYSEEYSDPKISTRELINNYSTKKEDNLEYDEEYNKAKEQLFYYLDGTLGNGNGDHVILVHELEEMAIEQYGKERWDKVYNNLLSGKKGKDWITSEQQLADIILGLKNEVDGDQVDENTDLDKIMTELENILGSKEYSKKHTDPTTSTREILKDYNPDKKNVTEYNKAKEQLFYDLDKTLGNGNGDHVILVHELAGLAIKEYGKERWEQVYNNLLSGKKGKDWIANEQQLADIIEALKDTQTPYNNFEDAVRTFYRGHIDEKQLFSSLDSVLSDSNEGNNKITLGELEKAVTDEWGSKTWDKMKELAGIEQSEGNFIGKPETLANLINQLPIAINELSSEYNDLTTELLGDGWKTVQYHFGN